MREPPGPLWGRAASLCLLGLAAVCAGGRRGVLSGRAAGCARGRRPAREPSAPRASLGASPRSPARPRHRPRAPQPGPAAAHRNRGQAPPAPRPGPAGLAAASNRSVCLCAARPGPAVAHGCRSQAQVLWLAYGSARQAARSSETAIAFACACMRGIETAITFAGEKRAFLVQFPGAKVSLVSMVAVRGQALVL